MTDQWPRAIIFDLDGTLVDSALDIADSLNVALTSERLPPLPPEKVRLMVGGGARILVERALAALEQDPVEALCARLEEAFETHYNSLGAGKSKVYPGGLQLLRDLKSEGKALGVCTNKPASVARMVLQELDVAELLGAIVGADHETPKKPDPTMLQNALGQLSAASQEALVVGDSITDVEMARALSVPVVAVSYGYTTIPPLELGADKVIDHLSDLPAVIREVCNDQRATRPLGDSS